MHTLLSFFSDLLLFTGGLIVALVWVLLTAAILIEMYDHFTESKSQVDLDDDLEDY